MDSPPLILAFFLGCIAGAIALTLIVVGIIAFCDWLDRRRS